MFELVWQRIEQHQGQIFRTKSGKEFRYVCSGGVVRPIGTKYQITRAECRQVFELGAISAPGLLRSEVRGAPYVWAILNDRRIMP